MSFKTFYKESMINKLLVINVAVYLILGLVRAIMSLMDCEVLFDIFGRSFLELSAEPKRLFLRLWTPLSYMFVHLDFWNFFGNMLWLFFMGRIFESHFNGKQTLGLYLIGGLSGALLFVLFFNIIPAFQQSRMLYTYIGASAAISALVIAICVARPNMEIRFFGIFPLSLKWLAVLYVVFDLLSIGSGNAGEYIGHIGGLAAGLVFALRIRKGKDITAWLNSIIDWIVSVWPSRRVRAAKAKMNITYKNAEYSVYSDTAASSGGDSGKKNASDQQRIDGILDKISKSGYNNLSKEDKDFLFKASRK